MLGIDRQHGGPGRRGAPHEQRAGTDQTLLIGERHMGAALGRGQCRPQAGGAGDRGHHPISRTLRRFDDSLGAGAGFDAGTGQLGLEVVVQIRISDGGKARAEIARQFGQAQPRCGSR